MFKMRHIFGSLRNARKHFQNAREGVSNAPFSRNCARSGSTAEHRRGERGKPRLGEKKEKLILEKEKNQLKRKRKEKKITTQKISRL